MLSHELSSTHSLHGFGRCPDLRPTQKAMVSMKLDYPLGTMQSWSRCFFWRAKSLLSRQLHSGRRSSWLLVSTGYLRRWHKLGTKFAKSTRKSDSEGGTTNQRRVRDIQTSPFDDDASVEQEVELVKRYFFLLLEDPEAQLPSVAAQERKQDEK